MHSSPVRCVQGGSWLSLDCFLEAHNESENGSIVCALFGGVWCREGMGQFWVLSSGSYSSEKHVENVERLMLLLQVQYGPN